MNASSLRGQTILVVDDDPEILEWVGQLLSDQDCVVTTAADGLEGLRYFTRGHFDLVITDRMMPRMTGDELARAVKARSPGTPVVLVSGSLREVEDGNRFDAVLAKPFAHAQLLSVLIELLPVEAPNERE